MIKQKFDEPKEQLEEEIKEQNNKLEKIRKAYINGAFELKEYKERTRTRKDYTRKEKSELIIKYVDDIELAFIRNVVAIKQINFRDSIYRPSELCS